MIIFWLELEICVILYIVGKILSDFLVKITGESAMNQLSPPEFSRLKPEAADNLKESVEKNISPQEFSRLIQEEQKWLNDHLDELIHKYPGKIVAIEQGHVVGAGNDYSEVCEPFFKQGRGIMPLVFQVPHL